MRFQDGFWLGHDTWTAVDRLHQKIGQGLQEAQELVAYAQEWQNVQETFAQSLIAMQTKSQIMKYNKEGFDMDEGASLKQAYYHIRQQTQELAREHQAFAKALREAVINPLRVWSEESRKLFKLKQAEVRDLNKEFQQHIRDVANKRRLYEENCVIVTDLKNALDGYKPQTVSNGETADQHAVPSDYLEVVVNIGPLSLSRLELDKLIAKMQHDIPQKEYKIPILGSYFAVSGADICAWMLKNVESGNLTEEQCLQCGQDMIDLKIISLLGRSNKFVAKENWYYQWIKSEKDLLLGKLHGAELRLQDADQQYRETVLAAEKHRQMFEKEVTDHLLFLQNLELTRLSSVKQSLNTLSMASSGLSTAFQNISNSMILTVGCMSPEKDLQIMFDQYKSGTVKPDPFLYYNNFHSCAKDQLFGVALADVHKGTGAPVPWIVEEILMAITTNFESKQNPVKDVEERLSILIQSTETDLNAIFGARNSFDRFDRISSEQMLKDFSVITLIAVLRRYFIELPVSLIHSDDYEALKALYLSRPEEVIVTQQRLESINNLVNSQPESHRQTISKLFGTLHKLLIDDGIDKNCDLVDSPTVQTLPNHALLSQFLADWGYILVRPTKQSSLTIYDSFMDRLVKDLLVNSPYLTNNAVEIELSDPVPTSPSQTEGTDSPSKEKAEVAKNENQSDTLSGDFLDDVNTDS